MGEFKQIQEILSKIGTEFFKIDEEMTEKNEAEDDNSNSLKSTWNETDSNSSHFLHAAWWFKNANFVSFCT